MRSPKVLKLILAALGLFGCPAPRKEQSPRSTWSIGFWFWTGGSTVPVAAGDKIDDIYCHVGDLAKGGQPANSPWNVFGSLPQPMPQASRYWLVFRSEVPSVPPEQAATELLRVIPGLLEKANRHGLKVAGIQLDIDSPTRALPQYAAFIRSVRKGLPANLQISITALLDWFRGGTDVGDVIKEVDEFVPQFYDLQTRNSYSGGSAIAAPIAGTKWGPIFNRYRKRFRIGISTFGRSRIVPKASSPEFGQKRAAVAYADLKPLDIAILPGFQLESSTTDAQELVLRYRAEQKWSFGYLNLKPGDAIEFTLSSPAAIKAAVKESRAMNGYCAGVIFFRWPIFNEVMVAQPEEVLAAAGEVSGSSKPDQIRTVDGGCAVVHCVDLYLRISKPLSPRPTRYQVVSSTELEYFLPNGNMPVRMSGPSVIEVSMPPFCGRGEMLLGRVVSSKSAVFSVAEEK